MILAGSISFALRTPTLSIDQVQIKGIHLADKSAITTMAMQAHGQNILLLRKSPIIRKIREINEIKNVKMGRRFPNRVWVRVWERKPDVVITDNSCYCLAQSDGFMFHRTSGPVKGLPIVELGDSERVKAGKKVSSMIAQCALEVFKYARKDGLKLSKISVDPDGDMCLNMGSDFYVKLGQPDDIALKMSLLRNTLAHKPSIVRDGAYIDLSCPKYPVWKPKEVAQAAS